MKCAQKFAAMSGVQRQEIAAGGNVPSKLVLKHLFADSVGSRAIDHCEPCQVLTEAALSGTVGVPRGSLIFRSRTDASVQMCAFRRPSVRADGFLFPLHQYLPQS